MFDASRALLWMIAIPVFAAAILGLSGKSLSPRAAGRLGLGAVLLSFALAVFVFTAVLADDRIVTFLGTTWFEIRASNTGTIPVGYHFVADSLSALMAMVVTGVGSIIHAFSTRYMEEDAGIRRYFAYLNLFVAAMLVLVLAANLPLLFLGWEGVGVCSYLLIGFWWQNPKFADAGRKAFMFNRVADLAFLIGMILLAYATRSVELAAIRELPGPLDAPFRLGTFSPGTIGGVAACLLAIGCMGKSAQWPLHLWLKDAMAGPTPVSALIHAATMVTAGIYLTCRLNPLFASTIDVSRFIATIGTITALSAAIIACFQNGLKRTLAYSTVSQLGFMFTAVGLGAYSAAFFHVFTHAFFKALLFLGAGAVMHSAHVHNEVQLGEISQLRERQPILRWTFLIGALALAGMPGTAGFFSKEQILLAAISSGQALFSAPLFYAVLAALTVASACTAFYSLRLCLGLFHSPETADAKPAEHALPLEMTGSLVLLALFSIGASLMDLRALHLSFSPWSELISPILPERSFGGAGSAATSHAAETWTLILGLGALGAGLVLAWATRRRAISGAWLQVFSLDAVYRVLITKPLFQVARVLRGMDRAFVGGALNTAPKLAATATGFVVTRLQTGSVYVYATTMLVGLAAVAAWAMYPVPAFEAKELEPGRVSLNAQPGLGYEYRWDFNSDGTQDTDWSSSGAVQEHSFAAQDTRRTFLIVEFPSKRKELRVPLVVDEPMVLGDNLDLEDWQRDAATNAPALLTLRATGAIHLQPRGARVALNGRGVGQESGKSKEDQLVILQPRDTCTVGNGTIRFSPEVEVTLHVRNAFGNERRARSFVALSPLLGRGPLQHFGNGKLHPLPQFSTHTSLQTKRRIAGLP